MAGGHSNREGEKMKGNFIVFEGIDKVGKTTHSKILSNKINAKLYTSPQSPYNDIKSYINKDCEKLPSLLFYLSANLELSGIIRNDLKDTNVICDRYVLSTLSNHAVHVGSETVEKFYDIIESEIIQPDYLFLLTAKKGEIIKRLKKNHESHFDRLLLKTPEKIKTIQNEFKALAKRKIYGDIIEIDTTGDITNVADEIETYIL